MKEISGLYVIVDPHQMGGKDLVAITRLISEGGADIIQLRNKLDPEQIVLEQAKKIKEVCKINNTVFIVNDRMDISKLVGADGVHVGRDDTPVETCRKYLGENFIIGNSNSTFKEAQQSSSLNLDYVAIGSLFETKTKKDTMPSSVEVIRNLKTSGYSIPIVGIGGINKERVLQVIDAGANAVCISSAITQSSKPKIETQEIKKLMLSYEK
tara:strand:- start:237 stop:869 length:633 start_codon:yes stop_codon:yes gene_type:complete